MGLLLLTQVRKLTKTRAGSRAQKEALREVRAEVARLDAMADASMVERARRKFSHLRDEMEIDDEALCSPDDDGSGFVPAWVYVGPKEV